MTKDEFALLVAEKSGLSREEADAAVDAFLESVAEALKNGEEIEIAGFGKLSTRGSTALQETADELRGSAEELDRGHQEFLRNVGRSQQTLKEIAKS